MELQTIFTAVLNMSITASVVIVCVMLARLVLRKMPRVFSCVLWTVVLFRLLCPVSVSGPASVLELVDAPERETSVGTVIYLEAPVRAPAETTYAAPGRLVETPAVAPITEPVEEPIDWNLRFTQVWAAGAAVLAAYGILSYVNLKRKLRESVPLEKGVRQADGIRSPFVLGLLRPVIYLPADLAGEERSYILLHERYHIRHGDHIVKALFFLAVCIHWFNPLVWLAFVLCDRDMELRCDEAVLKRLGDWVRSDYAQSLLNLSTGRRMTLCTPLAFGEGDTGKRVKHVLNWKKRAAWCLIPAAGLCAVVLVLTACDPGGGQFASDTPFGHSYKATTVVPTRYDEPVEQEELYTLTSDMSLFVRDAQETTQRGSFQKLSRLPDSCAAYDPVDWAILKGEVQNAWESGEYLLLQTEDGALYLIHGETRYYLERTDLLGVTIKQPGMESTVEPVWYEANSADWYSGSLSTTLVDGEAQVRFLVEKKHVQQITVSEEYYERLADSATDIHKNTYTLELDADGGCVLDVSRRGNEGDDYAIYRVTVGEEHYMFRLTFTAVPGVTAITSDWEEDTREVRFSEGGAYIDLWLPESWEYEITSLEDDAYSAGITFRPPGAQGWLRFDYYPNVFGVCGTGLTSTTMTVAGQTVTAGTYDDEPLWSFLSFGEHFAVWGENHESWWAEYGGTAMEILDSAQFGEYVDMDAVRYYFRDYRLDDLGPGAVLRGEKDYQAVYYRQLQELRLYEYAAAGTEVEVQGEWSGVVYPDSPISVNCLQVGNEYVYFGYLQDCEGGSFHFLFSNGWTIDMILDELKGFCFVCDEPMADFQLYGADGRLLLDLQKYLDSGCQVAEAEGKIVVDQTEGEIICTLPPAPTEP